MYQFNSRSTQSHTIHSQHKVAKIHTTNIDPHKPTHFQLGKNYQINSRSTQINTKSPKFHTNSHNAHKSTQTHTHFQFDKTYEFNSRSTEISTKPRNSPTHLPRVPENNVRSCWWAILQKESCNTLQIVVTLVPSWMLDLHWWALERGCTNYCPIAISPCPPPTS